MKRDILRRSSIGVIATGRTPSAATETTNAVVGADASLALFTNFETLAYYARSRTQGLSGDETSYRGRINYSGDKLEMDVDYLKVGNEFNPEVGFLTRRGFRRTFALGRFSPRPRWSGVRRLLWDVSLDNIDGAGDRELQTRTASSTFRVDLESGDILTANFAHREDRPDTTFRLAGGLIVQPGTYRYGQGTLSYQLGSQRTVTGTFSGTFGDFYGGKQNAVGYSGRVQLAKQLAVEPRLALTWLDLSQGAAMTRLVSPEPRIRCHRGCLWLRCSTTTQPPTSSVSIPGFVGSIDPAATSTWCTARGTIHQPGTSWRSPIDSWLPSSHGF